MVTTSKSSVSKLKFWRGWSWRTLLVSASVTFNIAFVVLLGVFLTSNVLDWGLADQGLVRYCKSENDHQFNGLNSRDAALRNFTCGRDDAQPYFVKGFQNYLDYKGIK